MNTQPTKSPAERDALIGAITAEATRAGFVYPELIHKLVDVDRLAGPASISAVLADMAREKPGMLQDQASPAADFEAVRPARRPTAVRDDEAIRRAELRAQQISRMYRNRM